MPFDTMRNPRVTVAEPKIVRVTAGNLGDAARLFDAYRMFYGQTSDLAAAREFVEARLRSDDSVVFLAIDDRESPLGFVQLYPSYSSVSMKRLWILNDLYVVEDARRSGVAVALLERARQLAVDTHAKGLILETAVDNAPAQALYERCGWKRDTEFHRYELNV